MPKFACSYAYDVSCYRDCVIEANTQEEAEQQMQAALAAGQLENVEAEIKFENIGNHRVFCMGEATEFATDTTLADLIAENAAAA